MQDNQHKLSFLYAAARLADALEMLDSVHNAASDDALDTLNARGNAEIIGWLREIAYIANETANELEQTSEQHTFRVIKGGLCGDDGDLSDSPHIDGEQPRFEVLVTDAPLYDVKQAGT